MIALAAGREVAVETPRRLSDAIGRLPEEGPVSLGALLAAVGSRAHGAALLLLSLPEAIPAPLPSVSAVLGVPLVIISAHLAVWGEAERLPQRLLDIRLPAWFLRFLRHRVAPFLARLEGVSQPRLEAIAARERLLGAVCLYLSALHLMPIPFFNVPPALCLVLLAWGMIQRDGVAALLGLIGTTVTTAVVVGFLDWVGRLLG